MIYRKEYIGFHKLRFNNRGADGEDRLTREDYASLRNRPYISGEAKGAQIIEKFTVEDSLGAQIFDVVLAEAQILYIACDLLQSAGYRITAAVRIFAEKYVEVCDFVSHSRMEISAAHRDFVEIGQKSEAGLVKHCSISFFNCFGGDDPCGKHFI